MSAPTKFCAHPHCRTLVAIGHTRCHQHAAADNARRYRKRLQHGRHTTAWQRLRSARLEHAGYQCELQLDDRCTLEATTVHLDPRLEGNHETAGLDDVRAACLHCHGVIDAPRARTGGVSGVATLALSPAPSFFRTETSAEVRCDD